MNDRVCNMRVTEAGYKYIGHYRRGVLEILLEDDCSGVAVQLKDEFSLYDLFMCFGIDAENGKWLHDLEGKFCRVHFDNNGNVKMITHIISDKIRWTPKETYDD